MKKLLITLLLWGVAAPAFAAHLEFFWARNTETDMKDYQFYSSPVTPCVPATNTLLATVPQPASGTEVKLDVPHGLQGFACVTARDLSNNESGVSNTVPFDAKSPIVPGGLGVRSK